MSCQLSAISKFHDISAVRKFFFPTSKENTPVREKLQNIQNEESPLQSVEQEEEDDWNTDWGFDDQESAPEHESESNESSNESDESTKWLQTCLVSLSPANDVLTVAHQHKICVLTQKWDPKNKGEEIDTHLIPVWEGTLGVDEKETITAVMCLPLASQKRSTQGGPDWTCIVVGFSSGYVRMYSQNGVLLLAQLLHMEKVERLKCKTYAPPRFLGMAETHDELFIMYTRAIVSIDGFSLIQSLRACRNQVARATASGSENVLQPPPLAYKKWSLGEQEKVSDYVACGVVCANPFDQLKAASMLGGVRATVKTSPPAMSVFMTAGTGPYVGFFYAIEGFTQPILSEVAIAMANKIKSALLNAASGWLGFGGKAKEEKEKPPKIEPATPLPLRFGLPDRRRAGDIILLSPCNSYAATTDSFGRVILIDVHRGMAVRMWKGYRDAQLGWVEVVEENVETGRNVDHYRMAKFLIIYAPRRGILEVWLSAHGPRVAAFNVSKSCRLICPSYGMMGLNNVTCRGIRSKVFQCALIDPDGVIKTIDIPFHLALSDKSSKRARDLHLLKKLKTFLKESSDDREGLEETITELMLDLKVASIAHQAIERVLSTRYLPVKLMRNVVRACIKKLEARGDASLDLDSRIMLKFCKAQKALLAMYASVLQLNSGPQETTKLSEEEILKDSLGCIPREATTVIKLLQRFKLLNEPLSDVDKKPSHVTFQEDHAPLLATSFLHTFSYRTLFSSEEEQSQATSSAASPSKVTTITISKEATEERRLALAEFLFGACLNGHCQAQELMGVIRESNLPPDQLMNLLLLHWLSSNQRELSQIPALYELIKTITAMADVNEVQVDSNEFSAWWTRVRNMCSQSENCCAAYLAVLTCKAVAAQALGDPNKGKDPDADTASNASDDNPDGETAGHGDISLDSQEWEALTVDMELWEVLLRQCEDLMALSSLLYLQLETQEPPLKTSVARLLQSGKGSVPEMIARYVVQQNLNPASLFFNYSVNVEEEIDEAEEDSSVADTEKKEPTGEKEEEKKVMEVSEEDKIRDMSPPDRVKSQLEELRHRFPNSLHNDILLANCCWEYAVVWNKDPELSQKFELSLEFLRLVDNAVLRQGVSSLLWHMFLRKKVTAAAYLMEKVGKPPKERLCRKEVGMSDSSLVTFITQCAEFMQIIMDANCEANEVPVYNLEHAWQKVQGPASLVELAVDQKATNYGLLKVHLHLLKMMTAILTLGIKSVKVLSLFDNKGRGALFKELHAHPLLPSQKLEHDLIIARKNFFCRVITEAVRTIGPPETSSEGEKSSWSSPHYKRQRSLYPTAFKWPQEVLTLAKDFGMDLDYLKRHHVIELYSFGLDKLAEEVMLSVNDHEEMGNQLLTLCGQRVAYEIFKRDLDSNFQHLASMSTSLTRWLQSLDPMKLHFPVVPLSDTVTVLEHTASKLQNETTLHELAIELMEKTRMLDSRRRHKS